MVTLGKQAVLKGISKSLNGWENEFNNLLSTSVSQSLLKHFKIIPPLPPKTKQTKPKQQKFQNKA